MALCVEICSLSVTSGSSACDTASFLFHGCVPGVDHASVLDGAGLGVRRSLLTALFLCPFLLCAFGDLSQ